MGCGEYSVGSSTCKYGFQVRDELLCQVCSRKEDLTHYKDHFSRFYSLVKLYDKGKQEILDFIKSHIKSGDQTMAFDYTKLSLKTKERKK